jgi:hypothetical protein
MIAQSWLNIAGLCLDFVGVVLLAFEWWLALSAERIEAETEDRERRLAPHPSMPRPNNPHQAVFDHMRAQHSANVKSQRRSLTRGMRRGWFVTAMIMIAAGFLLQILGSWPGCCSLVGIMPSGG